MGGGGERCVLAIQVCLQQHPPECSFLSIVVSFQFRIIMQMFHDGWSVSWFVQTNPPSSSDDDNAFAWFLGWIKILRLISILIRLFVYQHTAIETTSTMLLLILTVLESVCFALETRVVVVAKITTFCARSNFTSSLVESNGKRWFSINNNHPIYIQ